MFGFSFAELIVVLIVALFFIKPQDLPEIAHFFGKIFYRAKHFYNSLKKSLKEMENEFGIDDLKHEINRGIAEEKAKLQDETTVIVDIYGKEHHVPNLKEMRPDLDEEGLKKEVEELNKINKAPKP